MWKTQAIRMTIISFSPNLYHCQLVTLCLRLSVRSYIFWNLSTQVVLLSHAKNRSGSKGLHCDRQYQTEDTGKEAVKQSGNHMKCKKMLQSTDRPFDHNYMCSRNLCNLEIALHIHRIQKLCANLEIARHQCEISRLSNFCCMHNWTQGIIQGSIVYKGGEH